MNRRSSLANTACRSLLAAALLLAPAAAHADADAKSASALRPGAWALQFSINDNFQLGSFDGSVISIKHHTSAGSAWRLGVSTQIMGWNRDESQDFVSPDTTLTQSDESDQVSFGMGVTRLCYPHPGERVSAYYGAGPFFQVSNTDNTHESGGGELRQENHSWAAGANFVFGGEWFPARSLGIHAEYGALFQYVKESSKFTPPPSSGGPTASTDASRWQFRGDGVRFGASWYF